MCGIAGYLHAASSLGADEMALRVKRMTDAIAHRGPDDSGVWTDETAGIGLGHRRLSIIDISPLGHQPMHSADARYVITYNGEVYNFPELRAELIQHGHTFISTSDTEVMLAAMTRWGIEAAVKRFIGMFAFAIWDRRDHVLHLVRDRVGVKPLYWSLRGNLLLFGSELKALMAHPAWHGELNREAVAAFIRHSYIPGPHTIFSGVHKLTPGSILTFKPGAAPRITPYWSLSDSLEPKPARAIDPASAIEQLDALLRDTVKRRMISDVPLGAFLSGGIDSSTVVALMQAQSNRKVRTFSIGFHEQAYDEAKYAKAVAAHLGTDHTELYVSPREALDVVPRLADWFDEPFGDSSQIPTFLVSQMTRSHVTVALSGDGGDELFAGYPRYLLAESLWRRIGRLPIAIRAPLASLLESMPEKTLDSLSGLLPARWRTLNGGRKLHRLARLLRMPVDDGIHAELAAMWPFDDRLVPGTMGALAIAADSSLKTRLPDFLARMQFYDLHSYLPDDILVKVDRASMAVALEAREPLLDHRLIEFAWSLPRGLKMRDGQSKWILRQVLDKYVPRHLFDRPKMGFSVPLGGWLRGPLRDWARALLEPSRIAADSIFAPDQVATLWTEHQSGSANRETVLWNVLMFQAWQDRYRVS
jgi:asparagine synthase (glutamine-hydrolysing)